MKLKMSLPERPGWIFVVPGFDFIALLLALVMLTGVVAREGYVEVKLPPSEFRGLRMGDEDPVVILLKSTSNGPVYYVSNNKIALDDLEEVVFKEAEKRGTNVVIVRIDERATTAQQWQLLNLFEGLDYRFYLAVRSPQADQEDKE